MRLRQGFRLRLLQRDMPTRQEVAIGNSVKSEDCRALSVSWRLSKTWLSGRRVSSLRCECKLKPQTSTNRRTTMKIMVGIDLHSNNALCGLMDESGRRLLHKQLPCDLAAILQLLKPYKNRIATIAIESTYNWYWLVDGLQDHSYHVVLANPAAMQPYSGKKHTDDVSDAYFLAELLRLNLLPTGHLYDRKLRPVRDLLRRRMLLVRQRTTLILSFKSLNERTLGQRVPLARVKGMEPEDAQARFTEPADQLLAGEQITLMAHYTDAITKIEKHILEVAEKSPAYQRLQEMPGIGKILGLTIALETGDAQRFADAGHFASYCRCVKSVRQSNQKKKGENNRKCGNTYLAWAFVEAAHFACRHDEPCRRFYDRKKQKTNPVIATKSLACKLAKAAWHVMAKDAPYDATRVFGTGKKKDFGETGREPAKGSGHLSQQD
jgi:transposase